MVPPEAIPAPPGDCAWDIRITRLVQAARPQVEACARDLARRFRAIGIGCDMQVRPTPRGLSIFLALIGRRGLICIVDLTLVDGMVVGQGPCAALDVRLLDACGDVVEGGMASGARGLGSGEPEAARTLIGEALDRTVDAVYVATLAQFDLLRSTGRRD